MVQAYEDIPLKPLDETRLRDVKKEKFEVHKVDMPHRFAKRAEHFYSECGRVEKGIEAWKNGDIETFGRYIFESCDSSINNYECGSPELIAIYEIMRRTEGIYGGRFSGAGFKGACIALVDPNKKEEISKSVTEEYLKLFPQYKGTFEVFFCKPCGGVDFL